MSVIMGEKVIESEAGNALAPVLSTFTGSGR